MKHLMFLSINVRVSFASYLHAGSVFDQATDTAIDSKEVEKQGQWSNPFPSYPHRTDEERKQFLDEINQRIPTPTPEIEKDKQK